MMTTKFNIRNRHYKAQTLHNLNSYLEVRRDKNEVKRIKNLDNKRKKTKIDYERDKKYSNVMPQGFFPATNISDSLNKIGEELEDFNKKAHSIPTEQINIFMESLVEASGDMKKILPILEDFKMKCPDFNSPDAFGKLSKTAGVNFSDGVKETSFKTIKNICLGTTFVGSVLHYCSSGENRSARYVIISAMGLILFGDVFSDISLFKYIYRILKSIDFSTLIRKEEGNESPNPVPQMKFSDFDNLIDSCCVFFTGYLSTTFDRNIPKSLFQNFSTLAKSRNSFLDMMHSLVSVIETVINWIKCDLLKGTPFKFFSTGCAEVESFGKEVALWHRKARDGDLPKDRQTLLNLDAAVSKGKSIYGTIPNDHKTNHIKTLLWSDIQTLIKLKEEYEIRRINVRGTRQEPVCVLIRGGPATTKSIVLEYIASAFLSATLPEEDLAVFKTNPEVFIYNKNASSQYEDGLTHKHQVRYLDEFGQSVDVAGASSQYIDFISAANGFENMTAQAELHNKGQITSQDKLIIATTNEIVFNPKSIISKEAMLRRFDFHFTVIPKPEYVLDSTSCNDIYNQKFDFTKVPHDPISGESVISPDIQHFILTDVEGVPLTNHKPYTFDDVKKMILDKYIQKTVWFTNNRKKFNEIAKEDSVNLREYVNQQLNQKLPNRFDTIQPQSGAGWLPGSEPITPPVVGFEFEDYQPAEIGIEAVHEVLSEPVSSVEDLYEKKVAKEPVWISYLHKNYPEADVLNFLKFYKWLQDKYKSDLCAQLASMENDLWHGEVQGRFVQNYTEYFRMELILFGLWNYDRNVLIDYFRFRGKLKDNIMFEYSVDSIIDLDLHKYKPDQSKFVEKCKCLFQSLTQGLWPLESILIGSLKALCIMVPVVFGVIAASKYIKVLSKWVCSFFNIQNVAQSYNSGDKKKSNHTNLTKKSTNELRQQLKNAKLQTVRPESGVFDSSGRELVRSLVEHNLYSVNIENQEGIMMQHAGHAFFVIGNISTFPRHMLLDLTKKVLDSPEASSYKICLSKKGVVRYRVDLMYVLENYVSDSLVLADAALVKWPISVQHCRNRLQNFLQESDLTYGINNVPYTLPVGVDDVEYHNGVCRLVETSLPVKNQAYGSYDIARFIEYQQCTKQGDCGAPLVVLNTKLGNRKIAGIHIAGEENLGRGYSNIITQEMLKSDLKLFDDSEILLEDNLNLPEPQSVPVCISDRFDVLGKVPFTHMTYPKVHKIIASPMHSSVSECTTKPVHLSVFENEGKVIDPYAIALQKFCIPAPSIPVKDLHRACKDTETYLRSMAKTRVEKRVYTAHEALYGLPLDSDFRAMDSSSSAGFDINFQRNSWKSRLFSEEYDRSESSELHRKYVDHIADILDIYANNKRPLWICTDNAKEERKECDKVDLGKMRLFFGAPFDYFTIIRQYFGAFMNELKKNHNYNGMAIGLNPYSMDWDILVRDLSHFTFPDEDIMVGAGDYSGFDGSEVSEIHLEILNIINRWYGDSDYNQKLRRKLWLEVTGSRHVHGNVLYEWFGSLPSGHPLTPIINCIYNMIAFRLSFFRVYPEFNFADNVVLKVMGDDNIFAVSHKCRPLFNEITLQDLMKLWGLKYTTELKCAAEFAFRPITSVEFLKRSFVYVEELNRWIAPLRLSTALEICYWTKNDAKAYETIASNILETCSELSLHSKEVYVQYTEGLSNWFYKHNVDALCELKKPITEDFELRRRNTLSLEFYY